ncbi:MAG: peptidoglycan-binding domain-containing protein [Proteobacteria bacterium]|nr:peptidoglycan-binding domain-containing protein [Pseudomonadota bacterium]
MSERNDPFQPLAKRRRTPYPALSLAAPVGPPDLPNTRNRPEDVRGVETALGRAGYPGLNQSSERGVFDSRLDDGIRDFQRRYKLKVDGLLNPTGPTSQAISRVLARATAKRRPTPPLQGLSGEAYAANGRLVRHLIGAAADGIVPDLMAGDFRANQAGRAKTADFISQMFARDPARAKSLHAKAQARMEIDEKSLLDRLVLQARKSGAENQADDDDDDEPTPDDPGQDDDPDDDEPEEPDEPDEPKPNEEKCKRLKVELANAEQAAKEAVERMREAAEDFNKKSREVEARWQEFLKKAAAFGIGNIGALLELRRGKKPKSLTLPSEVSDALAAYRKAFQESTAALEKQKAAQAELDTKEADAEAIRDQIKENGCEY